jgi:peptidoglycan/LPS O-acetylase OafA/YrhL
MQTIEQARAAVFGLPNVYFWSQDSYFSSNNFNPLLHLWSLGVELQFYLIVPLVAHFARNKYIFILLF